MAFPDTINDIEPFLDISQADYQLVQKYQQAKLNGNFSEASEILSQISNGNQKITSASRLNEIVNGIKDTANFYATNVESYVIRKQQEWQDVIDKFTYVGQWSSTIIYEKNNIVSYTVDGDKLLFICVVTSRNGVEPIDTNYWRQFTVRGKIGEKGKDTVFAFDWDSSVDYAINTIVQYNRYLWISTQANKNQTPQDGSVYWGIVLKTSQPIYPVQTTQPTNQDVGELWFEVI